MKSQFYSTSEARKHLSSLVNQVKYQQKRFSIGRHGHPEANLVPYENNYNKSIQPNDKKYELLSKSIRNSLYDLAKRYNLDLIILFGSHAKGTATSTSDLDIAVMPANNLKPDEEQSLYDDLVKIFQREDVDLVNLKTAYNILLEFEALANGKVLYQKSREFFIDKKMKAYFNYQDFKNYFKQQKNALLNKLDYL